MKRSQQLEPLSHDHFDGLLVASRLEKGLGSDVSSTILVDYLLSFWKGHLARHFEKEEDVLLPFVVEHRKDLAQRLRGEHRQIRDLIDGLADSKNQPVEQVEKLRELAGLMKGHIRFEERELFPSIEAEASNEQLDQIGRSLAIDHSEADLNWDPPFWEK